MQDVLTDGQELKIEDGDLAVGYSDNQHIHHILLASPGEYLQHPTLGVGIRNKINGVTSVLQIKREIRTQLLADRFTIDEISVINSVIKVEAFKKS